MPVLFEVERFPNPAQNNILLETFLSIKEEILNAIKPIKEKIISTNSHIVVTITPKETAIKYLVSDSELADEINLPLNRLKEGFKHIYGDSVFSFLFDYKMEVARQLLATGAHNVNEVGSKVGYSASSHFISAFKKKFGTTPKKFLMGLNV